MKKRSIGSDVLGKMNRLSPIKTSVTIKPLWPTEFIQITFEFEKKEGRRPNSEELDKMWRLFKVQKKMKTTSRSNKTPSTRRSLTYNEKVVRDPAFRHQCSLSLS